MVLSYVAEFYADEQRDKNGLPTVVNFHVVSIVMVNIFNGVSGGIALATWMFSRKLITSSLGRSQGYGKYVGQFFASIMFESLVTSGVVHSIAHRIFGSTFEGNAWVEVISHLGFTINVVLTALSFLLWIGPKHLPFRHPRWYEVLISLAVAGFAATFSFILKPFLPDPTDFDYPESTTFNRDLIILLQGKIQPAIEAVILVPTVMLLFSLWRLWKLLRTSTNVTQLEFNTYRISIVAVAIPLCLNWIHFRFHDDLVATIQNTFKMDHMELISAIRIVFHIPTWIFAIARLHYLRRLAEFNAGWPSMSLFEVLCPG